MCKHVSKVLGGKSFAPANVGLGSDVLNEWSDRAQEFEALGGDLVRGALCGSGAGLCRDGGRSSSRSDHSLSNRWFTLFSGTVPSRFLLMEWDQLSGILFLRRGRLEYCERVLDVLGFQIG